ncbi:DUF748 domain-containing protein [Paramagnetospirillum magnetotacticum]|uniref:DUF748 domain-containing protein n=1 Tax=Paramagnetospirillum magnetotacticum TaxID=188 RepID=UPI000696CB07|nr:DUF748 domain-containing protein [Paramagnetospirillum magnetotacticum]
MRVIGRMLWGHEIRRRHVVMAAAGAVALVLTIAWDLLPEAGFRWGVAKALRSLGMVEVSIDDTDISLFGGRLTVRKMLAQPALGKALGIGDFDLKFRWRPLLDRRLVLDRVAVEGIDIELKREGDGFVLNGLPLAVAATPPSAKDSSASPPWGIDVAGLELTNSRLHITDGDFIADIAVERLLVENVNSLDPRRAVSFTLKGSLNGAAIALSGTMRPFAAEPSFAAAAHVQSLALADFTVLAARGGLTELSGRADLSLSAEGSLLGTGPAIKTNGRVTFDSPSLTGFIAARTAKLDLEIARLAWDGTNLDLASTLHTEALEVKAAGVSATAGRLDLDLGSLAWDGAKAGLTGVKFTTEALAVSAPGGKGSAGKLSLDLKTLNWDGAKASISGRFDGATLAGKGEGGEGSAAALGLDMDRLDWDGRRIGWQGGLKGSAIRVAVAGHDAAPEAVDWSGRFDLDTADLAGKAEGKVVLGPLRLGVGDIRTALRAAEAQGKVAFGKAVEVDLSKARIDGLSVQDAAHKSDLAAVERVDAEALQLARDGGVSVAHLNAEGVNALRKEGQTGYPWRLETKHLRLDHAARETDGDVSVDEARIDGMLARINRTPEGFIGFISEDKPPKETKPAKPKDEDTPDIRIGRLVVGGDSRINLRDRTMSETMRIDVTPLDFSIANLDSETPDRDSPFEIKAGAGRGLIVASGSIRPFAEKISGRIDGKITAFELPPLSPYLAEALGVNLQSGHFDGTLGIGIDKGKLSGALDVALSNLFIAPPDPNVPPKPGKVDMPIATVLDLLRDGDDLIHLSLPIRGDTANPDVDISDAVAQAVGGALKSTLFTTLKLAFPVAALIELAMDADDQSRLALPPLSFAPGADTLSGEQEKTLGSVAELVKARAGLKLTLCGKADDSDWPVVAAKRRSADKPLLSKLESLVGFERPADFYGPPDHNLLSALAQRRTNAVRDFLADKGGVDPGRLFGCRPMVETAEKGPRVELLL